MTPLASIFIGIRNSFGDFWSISRLGGGAAKELSVSDESCREKLESDLLKLPVFVGNPTMFELEVGAEALAREGFCFSCGSVSNFIGIIRSCDGDAVKKCENTFNLPL